MLVQLVMGVPLEMVHGSFRIALIYMAGVLAGRAKNNYDIYASIWIIITTELVWIYDYKQLIITNYIH